MCATPDRNCSQLQIVVVLQRLEFSRSGLVVHISYPVMDEELDVAPRSPFKRFIPSSLSTIRNLLCRQTSMPHSRLSSSRSYGGCRDKQRHLRDQGVKNAITMRYLGTLRLLRSCCRSRCSPVARVDVTSHPPALRDWLRQ